MDIHDSGEFTRRLVALGELFDANLTPVKQALYFEALRDLPFADVARALNVSMKTCTFMPKPAELRKLAIGDDEDQTERAWMAMNTAMRSAGSYASLIVDDAALAETIVSLFRSWPEACAADLSPEMWANTRKAFGRVYRVLRDRSLLGGRYLVGICEQQNAGRAEWAPYTPVRRLTASGDVQALSLEEADAAKAQLAAVSHGLTQIGAEIEGLAIREERDAS